MTLSPFRFRAGGHPRSVLDPRMAYEASGGASSTALQVGVLEVDVSF